MDDERHGSDAGDANTKSPSNIANATSAIGDAGDAIVATLDDGLKYALSPSSIYRCTHRY
jgi:hypothetical protein